jgi:SAM-dependent MidA family methyltransferase
MSDRDYRRGPGVDSAGAGLRQLPAPEPDAAAHSERLQQAIRAEMAQRGGAVPFSRFMELALYAPGLGYYAAGARKFGAAGDFVTAPELSPLFGRCIARQCREVLARTGGNVLEFGAGSGAMAADVLAELERLQALPERYCILEPSPDLRQRQRQRIAERVPHLQQRVQWLDRLPEPGFRGVVLANEVLDAMPVERFCIGDHGVEASYVSWHEGRATAEFRPAEPALADAVANLQRSLSEPLTAGYVSEINPMLGPWLGALGDCLAEGLVLLIDYGYPRREYYHPQRDGGTLLCHYRHRAHDDPLVLIGLQDITASVDFTAVAEAALDAGLAVAGYTTQAHFLIGSGLDQLVADSDATDMRAHLELARQVKLLTLPGEMGERFKVMALTKNFEHPLAAFAVRDLRGRLG